MAGQSVTEVSNGSFIKIGGRTWWLLDRNSGLCVYYYEPNNDRYEHETRMDNYVNGLSTKEQGYIQTTSRIVEYVPELGDNPDNWYSYYRSQKLDFMDYYQFTEHKSVLVPKMDYYDSYWLRNYADSALSGTQYWKVNKDSNFGASSGGSFSCSAFHILNINLSLSVDSGSGTESNPYILTERVTIGKVKLRTSSTIISMPIYDPNIGIDGRNQLRIETVYGIGCYELVSVSDSKASPIRVQTGNGIKAIAKE